MGDVTHREQIELEIEKEIKQHEIRLRGFKAILALTDPESGNMPASVFSTLNKLTGNSSTPFSDTRPTEPRHIPLESVIATNMELHNVRGEMTSRSIYEFLVQRGYSGLSKDPELSINRISTALIKMTEKGSFRRTHHGKGREPSRYVWLGPFREDRPPTKYQWELPGWDEEKEVPEGTS